jgi:hypothetical protein
MVRRDEEKKRRRQKRLQKREQRQRQQAELQSATDPLRQLEKLLRTPPPATFPGACDSTLARPDTVKLELALLATDHEPGRSKVRYMEDAPRKGLLGPPDEEGEGGLTYSYVKGDWLGTLRLPFSGWSFRMCITINPATGLVAGWHGGD